MFQTTHVAYVKNIFSYILPLCICAHILSIRFVSQTSIKLKLNNRSKNSCDLEKRPVIEFDITCGGFVCFIIQYTTKAFEDKRFVWTTTKSNFRNEDGKIKNTCAKKKLCKKIICGFISRNCSSDNKIIGNM